MTVELEILGAACQRMRRDPKPSWVEFFREILGLQGLIRRHYRTPEDLANFYATETYAEILLMLSRLRERRFNREDPNEPTRVVTVRMPKSMHEALRAEACEHRTSMNQVCLSKLLQPIAPELVPRERWNPRQGPETDVDDRYEQATCPKCGAEDCEVAGQTDGKRRVQCSRCGEIVRFYSA